MDKCEKCGKKSEYGFRLCEVCYTALLDKTGKNIHWGGRWYEEEPRREETEEDNEG